MALQKRREGGRGKVLSVPMEEGAAAASSSPHLGTVRKCGGALLYLILSNPTAYAKPWESGMLQPSEGQIGPGRSLCPTGAVCISVGKGATGQSPARRVSMELGALVWGLGVLRSA